MILLGYTVFAVYLVRMKTKMKMTLLLLLFPLLLFFVAHADASDQGFKLKCPEEPVKALVGQNVTLICKSDPQSDLREKLINWKFNSTTILIYKGKNISPHETKQFKGRLHHLSGWNLSKGKLSLEISTVNKSDAGVYTCSVVHGPNCNVTLTVKKEDEQNSGAQDNNTPTTSGDHNIRIIIGTVAGFGGFAVGVVIGVPVGWLICKKCGERGEEQYEGERHEMEEMNR